MNCGKSLLLALSLMTGLVGVAKAHYAADDEYYQIKKISVDEVKSDVFNQEVRETINIKDYYGYNGANGFYQSTPTPTPMPTTASPIDQAGQIVRVGRDIVALGEDIYRLVSKGKPVVTTTYVPISVVPKVNGQPADPMEMENWKFPIKRTYEVYAENSYRIKVIKFRYSVMLSYGGTYEEKGAYIAGAQIIPESVEVLWGFDFTATMKLGSIQNQGTRSNPLAAATLLMEYTSSNVMKSQTQVDSFFITGRGQIRKI